MKKYKTLYDLRNNRNCIDVNKDFMNWWDNECRYKQTPYRFQDLVYGYQHHIMRSWLILIYYSIYEPDNSNIDFYKSELKFYINKFRESPSSINKRSFLKSEWIWFGNYDRDRYDDEYLDQRIMNIIIYALDSASSWNKTYNEKCDVDDNVKNRLFLEYKLNILKLIDHITNYIDYDVL